MDKDGCFNGDCGKHIRVDRKINTGTESEKFNLADLLEYYPNPTSDKVHLRFRSPAVRQILLRDLSGKLLIQRKTDSDYEQFDVSSFPNGMYQITIEDDLKRQAQLLLQIVK